MADDRIRPDDLYETDFVAWTEAQADALRARRSGGNALDYDHLAEEIADLGRSDVRACRSLIDRIVEHLIKLEAFPHDQAVPHWRREVRVFRRDLADTLTATIRLRLEPRLADVFSAMRSGLIEDGYDLAAFDREPYGWEQVVSPNWLPGGDG
ncbi:DUF29 domain-containing protein [Brevundimonas balnearis]|uniref:DUF29 domain-containing protein n=1 Tax=Brevundimonas balnearis TaxID=1572858 RepID=A0ABV6R2P7_9CAUL